MKCIICDQKYKPIASPYKCRQRPEKACTRCVLESSDLHKCNMTCQSHLVRKIDYHPLTDGFMGFGSMAQVTITTEEYLPSIFRFVYAKVTDIDIRLNHMNSISVDFKMQLFGSKELPKQIYEKEYWKAMHLIKELENQNISDIRNPAPIFVFRVNL